MVTALVAKDKKRELAASHAENKLRKTVVKILAEDADKFQDIYRNHPLVGSIAKFQGHILNLNFDYLLDQLLGISVRGNSIPTLSNLPPPHAGRKRDSAGLYRRWLSMKGGADCPVTVWHPHGTILQKGSLRLGLRDYGFQPTLFAGAFECFKAWEKEVLGSTVAKQPRSEKEYLTLLDRAKLLDVQDTSSKHKPIEKHDNWFTRFMLYDVIIIGAGIGPDEFGLRWLLVQRHRNFARVKYPKKRPKTLYCDVNKSIPLGLVELDVFGCWEDAWEKALS
jgi:mRNA-degrading endonuclease YafQ of YafQ-DinJ toxin-antitoxin module